MTTSTVQPTEANIAFARHAISHNCDGPITPFVLISRACEMRSVSHETAAAALYEEKILQKLFYAIKMERLAKKKNGRRML